MKKYFLLATTALLLGATVANAEVMEDGKVTMQVSATVRDLGLKVDDSYGVNNVEFGTIVYDADRQADASSFEDFALAYINPETGALEGRGPAFVGNAGAPQRGSFRMTGTSGNWVDPYLANADAEGYEALGMEVIQMICDYDGFAYFVPTYHIADDGEDADVVYVGGTLYGSEFDEGRNACTGSLEIMLEANMEEN